MLLEEGSGRAKSSRGNQVHVSGTRQIERGLSSYRGGGSGRAKIGQGLGKELGSFSYWAGGGVTGGFGEAPCGPSRELQEGWRQGWGPWGGPWAAPGRGAGRREVGRLGVSLD